MSDDVFGAFALLAVLALVSIGWLGGRMSRRRCQACSGTGKAKFAEKVERTYTQHDRLVILANQGVCLACEGKG